MHPRLACLLATAATVAVAAPTTASAKDTSPVPAASAPTVECDWAADGPTADGTILSNQAGEAGCLSVLVNQDWTTLRVYDVKTSPGWTYKVTYNGVGTASSVRVDFQNGKKKASIMMEFGKTVIK